MKYIIYNHQGKANLYERALNIRHRKVNVPPVDFVFTDQAIYGRVTNLNRMYANCYFVYPHSARPNITSDIEPIWPKITAEFVATIGHKEIMIMYGHNKPIHVVGWHLCELKKYKPRKINNVLFAPIHPRNHRIDKEANQKAFALLRNKDFNLTVRYLGSLERSGLSRVEGENINYVKGELTPSIEQIDEADVVVAYETFAYLAIARGVPTVTFAEAMPTHLIPRDRPIQLPKNWYIYLPYLRYPLDLFDGPTMDMLERAAESDDDIVEWRGRMIGTMPFDGEKLLQVVESYV